CGRVVLPWLAVDDDVLVESDTIDHPATKQPEIQIRTVPLKGMDHVLEQSALVFQLGLARTAEDDMGAQAYQQGGQEKVLRAIADQADALPDQVGFAMPQAAGQL